MGQLAVGQCIGQQAVPDGDPLETGHTGGESHTGPGFPPGGTLWVSVQGESAPRVEHSA